MLTSQTEYDVQAVRHLLAQEISRRFYAHTPAYQTFCDHVAKLPPEAVPVDHTAIRFVDRAATDEVATLAQALGMADHGENYRFPDKKLVARSFGVPGENSWKELKIFVSTPDYAAFTPETRALLEEDETLSPHRLSHKAKAILIRLDSEGHITAGEARRLMEELFDHFFCRTVPIRQTTAEAIGKESPVARIGAICAGELNHVSPLVNLLPESINTIETVRAAMESAGIAMAREEIEGNEGSILRQFGTQSDPRTATVLNDQNQPVSIQITNEYVELAERHPDESGHIYDRFLPENATNIYLSNTKT